MIFIPTGIIMIIHLRTMLQVFMAEVPGIHILDFQWDTIPLLVGVHPLALVLVGDIHITLPITAHTTVLTMILFTAHFIPLLGIMVILLFIPVIIMDTATDIEMAFTMDITAMDMVAAQAEDM